MKYVLQQHYNLQVLFVDNLTSEFENRKLLQILTEKINKNNAEFVVNLSQIQFINSTGLRFLISLLIETRNMGGDMSLIHVPEQVKKLLIMTKLQSIFTVFDTLDKVMASKTFVPQQAVSDSE